MGVNKFYLIYGLYPEPYTLSEYKMPGKAVALIIGIFSSICDNYFTKKMISVGLCVVLG